MVKENSREFRKIKMKIHNASNENASVTLKPKEIAEITTLGFNSLRIMQELLDVMLGNFDNGMNCPSCGRDYDETITGREYDGIFCGATANECYIVNAQKFLEDASQTLHTFKLVCLDLGVASSIDLA